MWEMSATDSTRENFWPRQARIPPEKGTKQSRGQVYVGVSMNLEGRNSNGLSQLFAAQR